VVSLTSSSGSLTRISYSNVSSTANFLPVSVVGLVGPISVVGAEFPSVNVPSYPSMTGVAVSSCGAYPVTVSGVHLTFSAGGGPTAGIGIADCPNATVTDNVLVGTAVSRVYPTELDGIALSNSGGVVDRNVISLPTYPSQGGNSFWTGVHVRGPLAPRSVSSNQVLGGTAQTLAGLWFDSLDSGGPLQVEKNTVALADDQGGAGLQFNSVGGAVGLTVRDNAITTATSPTSCVPNDGLVATGVSGLFERNRFVAAAAQHPVAASFSGPGQIELDDNHFFAGRTLSTSTTCGGAATGLELLDGAGPLRVWATGNTIEGNGDLGNSSTGVSCGESVSLTMTSNVVVGGQTPGAVALAPASSAGAGACFAPANFSHNYLSLSSGGQSWATSDLALKVVQTAVGVVDAAGNLRGAGTCFDFSKPQPRYQLAVGSACIDRGLAGTHQDTSAITADLDGNPRVVGLAADIGCSEHP
jgi:hypothetical protein